MTCADKHPRIQMYATAQSLPVNSLKQART